LTAGEKIEAAKKIFDSAEREGRSVSDDEEKQIYALLAEARHLQTKASLREGHPPPTWSTLDEAHADLSKPLPRLVLGCSGERPPASPARRPRGKGKLCADLFPAARQDPRDVIPPEDFLQSIGLGFHDGRLRAAMFEKTGSAGGFFVPEPLARFYLDDSLEAEVIRPRATVYPMEADTLTIAGFDMLDNSSTIAGIAFQWLPEGGTAIVSAGKVRGIKLIANKGACFLNASRELVADGAGISAQIEEKMRQALSYGMDSSFLRGTGAGQPLGILNSPCTITVAKVGSQVADTIRYENIVGMYARLLPRSQRSATWLVHPSTLPQLLGMTVPIKNLAGTENVGGGYLPVLQDGRMLGLEVVVTERCSSIGDLGDIILADLSMYAIGLRLDLVVESSNVPGWLQDLVDYRVIARFDGQPLMASAYTPRIGSTLSPFVILEAR
jgi:HK97 family phage major capsid protein